MLTAEEQELLDFDGREIHDFERQDAIDALHGENGDAFRTHLVAARWLDHWRESLMRTANTPTSGRDPSWYEGFEYAMQEVAAHLRLGDFLPGAQPYEQAKP